MSQAIVNYLSGGMHRALQLNYGHTPPMHTRFDMQTPPGSSCEAHAHSTAVLARGVSATAANKARCCTAAMGLEPAAGTSIGGVADIERPAWWHRCGWRFMQRVRYGQAPVTEPYAQHVGPEPEQGCRSWQHELHGAF